MTYSLRVKVAVIAALVAASPRGVCAQTASGQAEERFTYDQSGLRDPFMPLVRNGRIVGAVFERNTSGESPMPLLYGVLWDPGGESIALFDTDEARVGDKVGEYTVTEIREDSVVVTLEGKETVLNVVEETGGRVGR